MALSGFEMAVGGISSIPTTSGLCLIAYKLFGEQRLDASKIKSKKGAVKPIVSASKVANETVIRSVSSLSK